MKPEIRAWIEKITERAAIQFEGVGGHCIWRGMYYCSLVKWDLDRLTKLAGYLKEYGEPEHLIDEMREAYLKWKKEKPNG